MSHPPQRAISFQDTSYEYLTCRRPKSRNIAVLSPYPPVSGPTAPADLTTVILGFADRGSPDLAASVVGHLGRVAGRISNLLLTGDGTDHGTLS